MSINYLKCIYYVAAYVNQDPEHFLHDRNFSLIGSHCWWTSHKWACANHAVSFGFCFIISEIYQCHSSLKSHPWYWFLFIGISLLTRFRSWEWATRSTHVKHHVDVGFYLSGLKPASVVAGFRVGISLDFFVTYQTDSQCNCSLYTSSVLSLRLWITWYICQDPYVYDGELSFSCTVLDLGRNVNTHFKINLEVFFPLCLCNVYIFFVYFPKFLR